MSDDPRPGGPTPPGNAAATLTPHRVSETCARLASTRDERLCVQEILRSVVPAVGDFGFIHLRDNGQGLRLAGWTHHDEAERARLAEILETATAAGSGGGLRDRALAGETVVAGPDEAPLRELGGRGAVCAPLGSAGVVTCVRRTPSPPDPESLPFLSTVASCGGLALENARLAFQVEGARAGETEARRSLEFHGRLVDAVKEAVIATDVRGNITFWSRSAADLYGWRSDEVLGRNIAEVTPSPDSRELATDIMALMSTGEGWSGEFRVRDKRGEPFTAHVTNAPIYEGGQLVGFVGVSRDISPLVTARRELETARRTLDSVVDHAPWPFACLDRRGRVLHWSGGCEEAFGWATDEVLKRPMPPVQPEDFDDFLDALSPLHEGRVPALTLEDVPRHTRDGTRLRATVLHVPLRGGEGRIDGSVGFFLETLGA